MTRTVVAHGPEQAQGTGRRRPPGAPQRVQERLVAARGAGIFLVVLGLLLMIQPLEALETLRWVFGLFLVADAVLVASQGLAHRKQVGWTWWLAQAVVNVLFGAAVMFWPDLSVVALYYVLVVWVLVLGITAIVGRRAWCATATWGGRGC
ncbi:DUF308 domain-containing protein [Oerskovia sp. M15]